MKYCWYRPLRQPINITNIVKRIEVLIVYSLVFNSCCIFQVTILDPNMTPIIMNNKLISLRNSRKVIWTKTNFFMLLQNSWKIHCRYLLNWIFGKSMKWQWMIQMASCFFFCMYNACWACLRQNQTLDVWWNKKIKWVMVAVQMRQIINSGNRAIDRP